MSIHIGAEVGQIAPFILLPGDPLRAREISKHSFRGARCFNRVRGMLGYTGKVRLIGGGMRQASVMGTGMGQPTLAIYVSELIREYGVKILVRVGTCGAYALGLMPGDVIVASSAWTDSNIYAHWFNDERAHTAQADPELLAIVRQIAHERGTKIHEGTIHTTDRFYEQQEFMWDWKQRRDEGMSGVEMESYALFTLAAEYGCQAISILTVSDVFAEEGRSKVAPMTAQERQTSFHAMVELALAAGFEAERLTT